MTDQVRNDGRDHVGRHQGDEPRVQAGFGRRQAHRDSGAHRGDDTKDGSADAGPPLVDSVSRDAERLGDDR